MVNDLDTWITDTVSLDQLSDVKFNIPANNGDVLTYNSGTWSAQQPSGGGGGGSFNCSDLSACTLNSIGNVQAPAPAPNSVLTYDGNNWTAQPSGGSSFNCSDLQALNSCSALDEQTANDKTRSNFQPPASSYNLV